MLGAIYPLFIIPKLPLWCFPAGLVEQKVLQVYSVWSGGTTLRLYFIPAEFFHSLFSWVSVVCAGESLLEAPWLCISAGIEFL